MTTYKLVVRMEERDESVTSFFTEEFGEYRFAKRLAKILVKIPNIVKVELREILGGIESEIAVFHGDRRNGYRYVRARIT